MAMLLGKQAANARLAVLFPDAGAPTMRKMGVITVS
jgi:hypothetical protein